MEAFSGFEGTVSNGIVQSPTYTDDIDLVASKAEAYPPQILPRS